ncbi:serine hydrolase domain-containing protein [Gemmatimonas sp.]
MSISSRTYFARAVAACAALGFALAPLTAQTASRPSDTQLAASVDSLVQDAMRHGLAPGFGLALVHDGRVLLQRAYGYANVSRGVRATTDTRWYVASTSKSFTGFAMTLLAHEGALPFDTPMRDALPGVNWAPGVHPESLTVAHMLSHTHALDDRVVVISSAFTGAVPEPQWPSLLQQVRLGRRGALIYSNFGYNVAGMILDRRSTGGWRRVLDSAVFAPAGMRHTTAALSTVPANRLALPHDYAAAGFRAQPFDKRDATMHAAGGHVATLSDLARWVIVHTDSGRLNGTQLFPASAVRRAQQLLATHTENIGRRFGSFDREGWGAGWDIGSYEGTPMVSRFGGYASMRSHLSFLPSRRMGVVAMSNGGFGPSLTDIVATFAYDLDAGRPDATSRAKRRVDSLLARLPDARRAALQADSATRAQERTGPGVPTAMLVGRYESPDMGTLEFTPARAGTNSSVPLRYSWGVLRGALRTLDSATGRYRLAGGGTDFPVQFEWDGTPGAAPAVAVLVNGRRVPRANTPQ